MARREGEFQHRPTVANRKVYVASYQSLAIFGLNDGKNVKLPATRPVNMLVPLAAGERKIRGIVKSVDGHLVRVAKRDGSLLTVDTTEAEKNSRVAAP